MRGFDAAYSAGVYEGTLRTLIHLLKYAGMAPLAGPLGDRMAAAIPRERPFDCIVPVPLHWRRALKRGYNQSDLLARTVARRSDLPVLRALRRRRFTHFQAGLSNSKRRRNVDGAFAVRSFRRVAGKRILLVDDVMTTGATASACAAALKRAGANSVVLLTLARVDRRLPQGIMKTRAQTQGVS